MARRMTLLHLHAMDDEPLWRAALASHGIPSVCMPHGDGIVEQMQRDARVAGAGALIVDAPTLAPQGLTADKLLRRVQRINAELPVFLRLPYRARIGASEHAWAGSIGLAGLLPGSSGSRWRESIAPALGHILAHVGRGPLQAERIGEFLRVLDVQQTNGAAESVGLAFDTADHAEVEGLDLDAIALALRGPGGVTVEDRSYRGKTYRQCFVASDAVRWLGDGLGLKRARAILAGQALQQFGAMHHVVRERTFDDAFLFFRFDDGPAAQAAPDLAAVTAAMRARGGLDIADRPWHGKTYPQCFVGSEAVDWLVKRYGIGVGPAEAIGQKLVELGVIGHVVDDHAFGDANLFYRFIDG